MQVEKNKIIPFVLFVVAVALSVFIFFEFRENKIQAQKTDLPQVCFNQNCFSVEIAKTDLERARGLMFRENLAILAGMLFIFDKEAKHSFWMKNTLISLDIIWLSSKGEVISMVKNAQPCLANDCPALFPSQEASYVLEINAGIADKIGLRLGDKLMFDI